MQETRVFEQLQSAAEASPSPVYGAGLEYQLGRKSLASSNLAASALSR